MRILTKLLVRSACVFEDFSRRAHSAHLCTAYASGLQPPFARDKRVRAWTAGSARAETCRAALVWQDGRRRPRRSARCHEHRNTHLLPLLDNDPRRRQVKFRVRELPEGSRAIQTPVFVDQGRPHLEAATLDQVRKRGAWSTSEEDHHIFPGPSHSPLKSLTCRARRCELFLCSSPQCSIFSSLSCRAGASATFDVRQGSLKACAS